jgi:hypothetical protein
MGHGMEPSRDELNEAAAQLEDGGLSPAVADAFARCACAPTLRRERRGLEALNHYAGHDVELIPCRESGAGIAKWESVPSPWASDPAVIADLWHGRGDATNRGIGTRFRRFLFLPEKAGLIGIDVDVGHADGVDGLNEFYRMFGRVSLPAMLRNVEAGSFPCFTETPSGGWHLLFRQNGPALKPCLLCPGCEIKVGRLGLTAGGSEKGGKPYILHGSLQNIPPLPTFLAAAIAAKTAPRLITFPPWPRRAVGPQQGKNRARTACRGGGGGDGRSAPRQPIELCIEGQALRIYPYGRFGLHHLRPKRLWRWQRHNFHRRLGFQEMRCHEHD